MDKLRECPFCGGGFDKPLSPRATDNDPYLVHVAAPGGCPIDNVCVFLRGGVDAWNRRAGVDVESDAPPKLTAHWLTVAAERVRAGEPELDVMRDYGYVTARPTETAPCNNCGGKKVWRLTLRSAGASEILYLHTVR